jgi:hypothetical protein
MKAYWHIRGGRILLSDDIGSRADILRPIGFRCVGVWISNWTPLYIQEQLAVFVLISGLRRTFGIVAVAQCLSSQIWIQADGRTDGPHRLTLVEEQ